MKNNNKTQLWEAHILKGIDPIYYIRYLPKNAKASYYFLKVPAEKQSLLLEAIRSSTSLDINEYGEILFSDFGESAPENVFFMIKEMYEVQIS